MHADIPPTPLASEALSPPAPKLSLFRSLSHLLRRTTTENLSLCPSLPPSLSLSLSSLTLTPGLVLAVGLLKKGMDVLVLERDLTAIRGEGKYRGPIQVQSNALAALEALDAAVAEEVLAEGVMTGDRVNGLCDGASGDWYVKFDMFHLAADAGLPVTRVISRFTLQRILADACERIGGPGVLVNGSHVVGFEEEEGAGGGGSSSSLLRGGVWATLDDGSRVEGDLLIGADGIWSKVRSALFGRTDSATYAGYTCYTGIADFTPADIDTVGYRVFLGESGEELFLESFFFFLPLCFGRG